MMELTVEIAGVRLVNPLMTASGTCGYATEYEDFVDLRQLGAFVTKSITPEPRVGNPPQRVVETRAGMLNAIGLANVAGSFTSNNRRIVFPSFRTRSWHGLSYFRTHPRSLSPMNATPRSSSPTHRKG